MLIFRNIQQDQRRESWDQTKIRVGDWPSGYGESGLVG